MKRYFENKVLETLVDGKNLIKKMKKYFDQI